MNKTTIDKRLALLEVRRGPSTLIHCVQVGDGPALKVDGSECTAPHDKVIILGGVGYGDKNT